MKALLTAVRLASLGLVLATVALSLRADGNGRPRTPLSVAHLDEVRGLDTSKKIMNGLTCSEKNTQAANNNGGGIPGAPAPPPYVAGPGCSGNNVQVGASCLYCGDDDVNGPPQFESVVVDIGKQPTNGPPSKGVGQGSPVGCGALYIGRCGGHGVITDCFVAGGQSSGQCAVNITIYSSQQQ